MLGLLRRPVRRAPASRSRARPFLERLEARDCPAGPTITLNVAYGTSHNLILTGTVTDLLVPTRASADDLPAPALTVRFGGIVSGAVTTDANGNFQTTLQAASPGTVSATVTDALNLSASASVTLTNAPPLIVDFKGTAGAGNVWTFTGRVLDDQIVAGLVVSFGNSAPLSLCNETQVVTVQPNGTFSLTIQMNQNVSDCGTAVAQVSDWWGAPSNMAMTDVQQNL